MKILISKDQLKVFSKLKPLSVYLEILRLAVL